MYKNKDIYEFLDELKDGAIYDNRYNDNIVFSIPHVVIFANFEPMCGIISKHKLLVVTAGV